MIEASLPPRPGSPGRVLGTPLPWLAGLVVAYLTVPLVAYLVRLAGTPPGQMASPGVGAALVVSVETASIATAAIAVTAVPLAYLLARGRHRTSAVLGVAVQLPIALPPLMSGILLLYVVGPSSPLGQLAGGGLTDDLTGIVLAQIFVAAPFAVVAARSAFAAIAPALDDVAATLGHRPLARFIRVALPAAAPGVAAGLLLAWLRAFGEFGATVVLAYHPFSLPVFTFVQFGSTGLPATMLPVAASLAAAVLVLGLSAGLPHLRRPRRAPSPLPAGRGPAVRSGAPLSFDLAGHLGSFTLHITHQSGSRRLGILGPSGAGKTLTLRLLAGLAPLDRGHVRLGDADLTAVPAEARGVGYLPQDISLVPHLPVWDQATFGVGADPCLAAYWIDRLRLARLAHRQPDQLSGGQRRRVGLARALARDPRLLLLDEPLAGLDTPLRAELRAELRRLQLDTGLTTVVVTHDVDDAALLADELLILDGGRLLQAGRLPDLLAHPASSQVARLLGLTNIHAGVVVAEGRIRAGRLELDADTGDHPAGTRVGWSIRPGGVQITDTGGHAATITDVIDRGSHRDVELTLDAGPALTAHVPAGGPCEPGLRHGVRLVAAAVTLWPDQDRAGEAAGQRRAG